MRSGWLERLEAALRRRNVSVSVDQVVGALVDAFAPGERDRSLADDERRFVMAGGVPGAVDGAPHRTAGAIWRAASAIWEAHRQATWATPDEAAGLLGMDLSEIRILQATGDIHSARRHDGSTGLPSWQFAADGHLTPHVVDVVAAFPADYSAVNIETVMTTPAEELDGRSPAEWLQAELPLEDLLRFINELRF